MRKYQTQQIQPRARRNGWLRTVPEETLGGLGSRSYDRPRRFEFVIVTKRVNCARTEIDGDEAIVL